LRVIGKQGGVQCDGEITSGINLQPTDGIEYIPVISPFGELLLGAATILIGRIRCIIDQHLLRDKIDGKTVSLPQHGKNLRAGAVLTVNNRGVGETGRKTKMHARIPDLKMNPNGSALNERPH